MRIARFLFFKVLKMLNDNFAVDTFAEEAQQVVTEALTRLDWQKPQVTADDLVSLAVELGFSVSEMGDGLMVTDAAAQYYITCQNPPKLKRELWVERGTSIRVNIELEYMSSACWGVASKIKKGLSERCGLKVEPVELSERILRLPFPSWEVVRDGNYAYPKWRTVSEARRLWEVYQEQAQQLLRDQYSVQFPLTTWRGGPYSLTVNRQSQLMPKTVAQQQWDEYAKKVEAALSSVQQA